MPEYVWTDKCCDDVNWIRKVFPNIKVRLDLWHSMQRYWKTFNGKLKPRYKQCCHGLKEAYYYPISDIERSMAASGKYAPIRRVRAPSDLVDSIGEFIGRWMEAEDLLPPDQRLMTVETITCHTNQCKHFTCGCLEDPPDALLYTVPATGGRRICRGTSQLERWHMHMNANITRSGMHLAELQTTYLAFLWNLRKIKLLLPSIKTYDTTELQQLHEIGLLRDAIFRAFAKERGGAHSMGVRPALYPPLLLAHAEQVPSMFGFAHFRAASAGAHHSAVAAIPVSHGSPPRKSTSADFTSPSPKKHTRVSDKEFLCSLPALQVNDTKWHVDEYSLLRRLHCHVTDVTSCATIHQDQTEWMRMSADAITMLADAWQKSFAANEALPPLQRRKMCIRTETEILRKSELMMQHGLFKKMLSASTGTKYRPTLTHGFMEGEAEVSRGGAEGGTVVGHQSCSCDMYCAYMCL